MRKTLYILFSLIFTSNISAQNDLENNDLKGKVKSVERISYRTKKEKGKIIKLGVSFEEIATYNKHGYLLSSKARYTTQTLGTGAWRSSSFTMDKENRVVAATYKKNDAVIQTLTNTYSKNKMERTILSDKNEIRSKDVIKYDDNGNVIERVYLNLDGSVFKKETFEYDASNRVTVYNNYKGEKLFFTVKTSYPSANQKKEEKIMAADKYTTITAYLLDEDGKILEVKELKANNELVSTTKNKYNEHGDLILRQKFNEKGEEEEYNYMRYEYLYDKQGNWTTKTEYLFSGNSLEMTTRTIEYYN